MSSTEGLIIDWDNLPPCTGYLQVSPYICIDDTYIPPEPPVHQVPLPSTLPLMLLGVVAMMRFRFKTNT